MWSSRRGSARASGATSTSRTCSSLPDGWRLKSSFPRWKDLRRSAAHVITPTGKETALSEQTFGFEELKRILVDRIGLDESVVTDDPSATFEEMGLDSLALVEIQLAMEQEYGFTVADEDAQHI